MDHTSPTRTNKAALGATLRHMTKCGLYELIHSRMGHPGGKAMTQLHKHVDGVSKLNKPPLFCCHTCMLAKCTKQAITKQELHAALMVHLTKELEMKAIATLPTPKATDVEQTTRHSTDNCRSGMLFHMDMGFVMGTKFSVKDEDGHIKTSLRWIQYLLGCS
jgi:hypothetical protein